MARRRPIWSSGFSRLALEAIFNGASFFDSQRPAMSTLAERSTVPLPGIRWFEKDPSWLGYPFLVMDRVVGQTQPDSPPYTQSGWLHDASPEHQRKLWWSTIDTIAKINNVDWAELGLDDFLLEPSHGQPGFDERLQHYLAAYAWARGAARNEIVEQAGDWLVAHQPPAGELRLSWGDALGLANMVFRDFEVAAVLDWEMACLGPPLLDLAWFLFTAQAMFGDTQSGDPADPHWLRGFPPRSETIERWEDLTGCSAEHLPFFEVFSGFRMAVHVQRLGGCFVEAGLLPPESNWPSNNFATQTLAPLIGVEHPPPADLPSFW